MRKSLLTLLFVLLTPAATLAYEAAYVPAGQVKLEQLLPPPPAPGSEAQKRDLEAVLQAQNSRTPQQATRAVADNNQSIFYIAGEVLGPQFTAERLPKLNAFFNRFYGDVRAIYDIAKDGWNRPRPYKLSADVKFIGALPRTAGSYPSGHTIRGTTVAIMLANMVPEKQTDLFARGREYGDNRVVAGVHFPTDIDGGRLAATAIAAALLQNVTFQQDLITAKAELRQVLGLPTAP